MKHIIIAGSARSGKTTLATMIKERFPIYNLNHGDCIREWLIALYGKECAGKIVHSDDYPIAMLHLVNAMLKDDAQPYIEEWSRFYPSIINNLASCRECSFICLGHGGLTPELLLQRCRTYERETDFTATLTDDDLLNSCKRWAAVDTRMINECAMWNQPYNDTSENRMKVLQQLVSDLVP